MKTKNILLVVLLGILSFIAIIVIIAYYFGFFDRTAKPGPGEPCYGTDLKILDCYFSSTTKKITANIKLNSGSLDAIQGIISGKINGNVAGSYENIKIEFTSGESKKIDFQFDKTIDGDNVGDLKGPIKFQVRPIMEGNLCVQFHSKYCTRQ